MGQKNDLNKMAGNIFFFFLVFFLFFFVFFFKRL